MSTMILSIRRLSILLLLAAISSAAFAQPSARSGARMVFNEQTGSIILFAGLTPLDSSRASYGLDDTWEWSGRRWVRLLTETEPGGRGEHIMVYDSNRDQIVMFGGAARVDSDGADLRNDTWIFRDENWLQLDTPEAPEARRLAGAAFDPVRDRVVLFGGFSNTGPFRDTWEFDGTTWRQISASGPEITSPTLVYDPPHNEVLMLGVDLTGTAVMHRLVDGAWERLNPTAIPPCVVQGALVYHPLSGRVIQYGGLCATGFPASTTFVWDKDGNTWGSVPASPSAGAVFGAASAYDPNRSEILLFGGDSFGVRGETYRFVPDRWLFVQDASRPGPRTLGVFETDTIRNVIWLFGGQNESARFTDLWSYQNGRWDRVVAPNAPTGCLAPAGAFDKDRGRLVVICDDSSTFEFDGTTWFTFPNITEKPPARRWSSMAYDERNRRVVLFGGFNGVSYLRETWTWNGTAWTRAQRDGSPPARSLASMFFDPSQNRITLYGGIGRPNPEDAIERYADMWTFDGTRWTELENVTTPPARYGAMIEVDPRTNHAVLFGGKDQRENYINEQWEWDGTRWQQVNPENRPEPRMNGMMAWDPTLNTLTMFGGYAGGYFSEIWSYSDGRWTIRPDSTGGRQRPVVNSGGDAGKPSPFDRDLD